LSYIDAASATTEAARPDDGAREVEALTDALWTLLDAVQKRVQAVEERNGELAGETHALRATVRRLEREVGALTGRSDAADRHVEALRSDLALHRGLQWRSSAEPCPLTPRELEVLAELADGKVYKQIALALSVSVSTVRSHLHNVYHKLGAVDRAQAVLLARRYGWL
jgi:DNA-binding NarL/FixJ family response regulator